MDSSILLTIKQMLGMTPEYDVFDQELIMFINGALLRLIQLGVGPPEGFIITGDSETWRMFLGSRQDFTMAPTYVYQSVKLVFDPPPNSFLVTAIKDNIAKLEWLINVQAESPGY